MRSWLLAFRLALLALLASPLCMGQLRELSEYEEETLRRALERTGHAVDLTPEGKRVESIEVTSFEVFEDRDYLPTTFPTKSFNVAGVANWFHATSRPYVIRREVLLRPGRTFDWSLLTESERNLRVRQLSVVLIVPVQGSRPDLVRLLVVTKDVWSLRMNFEPRFINGSLDFLTLQPSEENLLGLHKTINATLTLSRSYYSLGLGFIDPRVGGSRLRATASGHVIFNCQTNDTEGSFGTLTYGKPLYSTRTEWSWIAAVSWQSRILRPFGNAGANLCSGGGSARLDFLETPGVDGVPFEYRYDALQSQFSLTRSFGIFWKNNFSVGVETRRVGATLLDDPRLTDATREEFRALLPRRDMRLGPFVQMRSYRNKFHRLVNVETLGLQEDFQLGHDIWMRVYPGLRALGGTRDLIGIYNGIEYSVPVLDGLARGFVEHQVELTLNDGPDGRDALEQSDAEVGGGLRFVSPKLGVARLVADADAAHRYRNFLNPFSYLGGTDRLRGYGPNVFGGPDHVVANFELRTLPVRISSILLGAVAFWDMGDAFTGLDAMDIKHGYGGGLRVLLPQLDRSVFRVDVGLPLDPSVPGAEPTVIAQFRQAFSAPHANPPGLVNQ